MKMDLIQQKTEELQHSNERIASLRTKISSLKTENQRKRERLDYCLAAPTPEAQEGRKYEEDLGELIFSYQNNSKSYEEIIQELHRRRARAAMERELIGK